MTWAALPRARPLISPGRLFFESVADTVQRLNHVEVVRDLFEPVAQSLDVAVDRAIVDDSSLVRRSIQRQLDSRTITEVFQAGNGLEALEIFRRELPDLVTMDITMPGMDGLACIVEMMRLRPQTRLMIISALGDAETAIEAVERGANEYVTKPFTADELNQALSHLIEHGA